MLPNFIVFRKTSLTNGYPPRILITIIDKINHSYLDARYICPTLTKEFSHTCHKSHCCRIRIKVSIFNVVPIILVTINFLHIYSPVKCHEMLSSFVPCKSVKSLRHGKTLLNFKPEFLVEWKAPRLKKKPELL